MITGRTQRKSGTIQLLDEARQPALKWNFREGWPSKWEGPALNAKNNDVAIETLEIAHEGLVLRHDPDRRPDDDPADAGPDDRARPGGRRTSRAGRLGRVGRPAVPRASSALRSDVAGFVGLATRGPTDHPKRLENVERVRRGVRTAAVDGMLLAPAVHGFFANGGTTCWVARAVDRATAACSSGTLAPGLVFRARTEGTWADRMAVDVQPAGGGRVTVTVTARDGRRELWRNLDRDGLTSTFGDESTSAASASGLVSLEFAPDTALPTKRASVTLSGGEDGLAGLLPRHLSGNGTEDAPVRFGAALLADIDEISQVVVPDLVLREPGNFLGLPAHEPQAVGFAQDQLVGALRDARPDGAAPPPRPRCPRRRGGGLVPAGARTRRTPRCTGPGCASRTPRTRTGCSPARRVATSPASWPAQTSRPARTSRPPTSPSPALSGCRRPVDDEDHGRANDGGVDAIRAVPGRGIRVMGARTTSQRPAVALPERPAARHACRAQPRGVRRLAGVRARRPGPSRRRGTRRPPFPRRPVARGRAGGAHGRRRLLGTGRGRGRSGRARWWLARRGDRAPAAVHRRSSWWYASTSRTSRQRSGGGGGRGGDDR